MPVLQRSLLRFIGYDLRVQCGFIGIGIGLLLLQRKQCRLDLRPVLCFRFQRGLPLFVCRLCGGGCLLRRILCAAECAAFFRQRGLLRGERVLVLRQRRIGVKLRPAFCQQPENLVGLRFLLRIGVICLTFFLLRLLVCLVARAALRQ